MILKDLAVSSFNALFVPAVKKATDVEDVKATFAYLAILGFLIVNLIYSLNV
jgi:hypothetical protein